MEKGETVYESEGYHVVASFWTRRAPFGAVRETTARSEQEVGGAEKRRRTLPRPM